MKSLFYLTSRKYKNKLYELLRSLLKLIVTLGLILLAVMNFSLESPSAEFLRPIDEFYAIIFLFYIFTFVTQANKGFAHGGSMFSLADVNFLFVSPLKPTWVLFHGMFGQLVSSLWMGIIFIYQFTLLKSVYPIDIGKMLICVITYGAVAFLSQLAGLLFYFFTCGEEVKIKRAKPVFYLMFSVFAVLFFWKLDLSSLTLQQAVTALCADYMKLFPVAGWAIAFIEGVFENVTAKIILPLGAALIFTAVVFTVMSRSPHGYYEDVLLSTEKNSENKTPSEVRLKEKNPLKSKGGIGKGKGASVFFYKHLVENRRTRSTFFTPGSLIYILLIAVYALVFRSDALSLFAMSCMASVITVVSGRWIKELTMPYIYIVPGSAVKKLFFLLPEMLPKVIAESLLQCVLIGVLTRLGVFTVTALFVSRIAFSFLLMSSSLLTAGILREKEKNNVFAALCVFFAALFSAPSVAMLSFSLYYGFGLAVGLAVMAAVNTVIGFLLLFPSRKLLKFSN